jgi:sulfite exporter TauE/SafE/copper chaperone CopZ
MIVKKGFIAEGTTCESCTKIIERQAKKVDGVTEINFDYSTEKGNVSFDDEKTDLDEILFKIEEKNYTCYILEEGCKPKNKKFGWIFGSIGILIIAFFIFHLIEGVQMPQITQDMGYGLLFLVGLLTGFHCVSMCGGFVISYTAKAAQENKSSKTSHLMYGLGKTLSYTIIGALFGLVGSIIAFTPAMRGFAGILAGMFLLLFGLKMLNIFPILRKISIRTPKFILRFLGKKQKQDIGPLGVGLLNGLMIACGPLQAIYIMAAGTGSMVEGAKLLFIFAVGTLPVLLGFGYFASYISSKATQRILKFSGIAVIILGIFMLNNGLVLTGSGYDLESVVGYVTGANQLSGPNNFGDGENNGVAVMKDGYQEIRMDVIRYGWKPDKFLLKKGVPVKWIVNGIEINGCNNAIQVPSLGLEFDIIPGEQTIEFTPNKVGNIRWSCWMGMIPGMFIVKDDIDLQDSGSAQEELNNVEVPAGGSCGGSGGGCGCGGGR